MRKNLFIFNSKLLWLLLPMLALAGTDLFLRNSEFAHSFLSRYSDVAFDNPLQFHLKLSKAQHEPGKKLVLILGSSIARESLDEKQLSTSLGSNTQVLNLGFFHGRSVDLWMLAPQIARLQPDLIVMPMMPGEPLVEYSFRLTMPFYFHWNIFALVGASELLSHPRDFLYAAIASFSFMIRYRDSIGSALYRWAKDALGIEAWHSRGAYRFGSEVEVLPPLDQKLSILGQEFVPGKELIIKAMDSFFQRQRLAKVPVIILTQPCHPKFTTELERLGMKEVLDWQREGFPREVKRWAEQWATIPLEPPPSLLKPSDYADYLHLNSQGRANFSAWFSLWLRDAKILERAF